MTASFLNTAKEQRSRPAKYHRAGGGGKRALGPEHYGRLASGYFSIRLRGEFPDWNKAEKLQLFLQEISFRAKKLGRFGQSKGAGFSVPASGISSNRY